MRNKMKKTLELFHQNNIAYYKESHSSEGLSYAQMLLVGHRSSGKTTELRVMCDDIKDKYECIMIHNIASSEDEFSNDKEFMYFVAKQVVAYCWKNKLILLRI